MSDEKIQKQLNIIKKATKEATQSKATALKALQNAGILTKSGKLSKLFGG